MQAIRVSATGGPEVLVPSEVSVPTPGPGQARVKVGAAGVNFIDVYFRTGLYKTALPFTPGMEGAGTVDALGAGVTEVAPGDRVAYAMNLGSYAEYALVTAWQLVRLPDAVDFRTGAAAMLQGMTAHYLTRSTYRLGPGDTALVHAAAGGAGLLVVQMAKLAGARVIGTVSTPEKEQLAREAGADHVIRYRETDFEAAVKELTGGRGVEVVYDSVGRDTFDRSLGALKRRGTLVLFGQSSGPVAPVDPTLLNTKGSLYLTRPTLGHYVADRDELAWRSGEVLGWLAQGKLRLRIHATYPLAEAAAAHRALQGRTTTGKLLLVP
jgi:NADPH2:quinone reductase